MIDEASLNAAGEVLDMLGVAGVWHNDLGQSLAVRLSRLAGVDVDVAFSTASSTDEKSEKRLYIVSAATSTIEYITNHQVLQSTSAHVIAVRPRGIDELDIVQPETLLLVRAIISPERQHLLKRFASAFLERFVHRQRALIRRDIIAAKVESQDLNSFFFRVLRSELLALLGFESASVFVIDRSSSLLRLRGSTRLRSQVPLREIFFDDGAHRPHVAKVWQTYKLRKPRFEFKADGLPEGRSAEATARGQFARAYWPIQLQFSRRAISGQRRAEVCVGTIRIVNRIDNNNRPLQLPFRWIDLTALEFASEAIYNIVDAFNATELAGFKKDESFHAAMGVVDAAAKSVDKSRRLLFPYSDSIDIDRPRFVIAPMSERKLFNPSLIKNFLDTAYACIKDIGYQIERANNEFVGDPRAITRRLITDVLQRSVELVPDMCIAHSITAGHKITNVLALLSNDNFPPPVRGDRDALVSVFSNLFENSVKYAKPGHAVRVDIAVRNLPESVEIELRDYGIGIEKGEEERIFRQGYRSDRALNRGARGTGLGLFWCKSVLQYYGGDVCATRIDGGVNVIVTLKRA